MIIEACTLPNSENGRMRIFPFLPERTVSFGITVMEKPALSTFLS